MMILIKIKLYLMRSGRLILDPLTNMNIDADLSTLRICQHRVQVKEYQYIVSILCHVRRYGTDTDRSK